MVLTARESPTLFVARLSLLSAGVLWSLAGVFIKFLPLPPLTIVFYRSFFAALFFVFLFQRGSSLPARALLVSAASYTAAISSFVAANKLTTAANAIVLQYAAPLFVFMIVTFLFRERIGAVTWLALGVGMSGIAVIFAGSAGQPDFAGVTVALLSGVLFSIYMVSLRFLKSVPAGTLTCINNSACCLLLLPFVLGQLSLTRAECLTVAIMGVVQLGIPYWLFSRAVETIPVHEASLLVLIEPVLNPLWVALAVGEIPAPATVVGGALIVAGLAVRYGWEANSVRLERDG
ncbi:MAG TPA: EamA family transporter [Candidatus Binatia bacterium]|nr:EamA family transporter [Candidatus Binatia bacterium]